MPTAFIHKHHHYRQNHHPEKSERIVNGNGDSGNGNHHYARPYINLPTGHGQGLSPLYPLNLKKVKNFSDLASAMAHTPFAGREVGLAVDILTRMSADPNTFTVMTLSGAMTPAKMGLVICDMIERGMVQAIVSTGALMAHGLVESTGLNHFWADGDTSDAQWYLAGYNRIHRALEPEHNLDEIERLFNQVVSQIDPSTVLSSRLITHKIGEYLHKSVTGRGILKSAYHMGVPVFVPAFTDSELGLDLGLLNINRVDQNLPIYSYNPFIDLDFYTELIRKQKGRKLGIFTIGGGVPRNWAQQVGPYLDIIDKRTSTSGDGPDPTMFHWAIRICPDNVNLGGLSGCTYEEGKSWGKFWPDAKTVEVLQDATVVWPLILAATLERLGKHQLEKKVFTGPQALEKIEKIVNSVYNPHLARS